MRALSAAVMLGALAAGACSSPLSAYESERARWTRSTEEYEDLVSRIFVDATLATEPFRRRYAEAYATLFDLDEARHDRLLESELAEHEERHVVVAVVHTHHEHWNRLDPARGIWEVRLEGPDEASVVPADVRRLDADDPTWRRLFPALKGHHEIWELHFPRETPDGEILARPGERVELVLAGAPARVRLGWILPADETP